MIGFNYKSRSEVAELLSELCCVAAKASRIVPSEFSARVRIEQHEEAAVLARIGRCAEICDELQQAARGVK